MTKQMNSQTKNLKTVHQNVNPNIEPNAGWRDIPWGGVIPRGGTAENFATGDWRTLRPVWSQEKCINCHRCWLYCPDMSWISKNGKIVGVDLRTCKGCGICANVCPAKVHAIEMFPEDNFREDEAAKEE